MLQAHYIKEGFNLSLAKVVVDLEKRGLIKEKEDVFRFKHTYYDSGNKILLKKGGYCRKNIRFDLDKNVPPRVIIEYRPQKKSHTRRYISEQEMSMEELSKVLGFNYHMAKSVKFRGHQLTMSYLLKEGKGGHAPHIDFIVQLGEILNRKTGAVKKVSIVSLIDTTASVYDVKVANYLSYKTERIISYFEKLMEDEEFEKLTSNRYSEIFKRIPEENEIEDGVGYPEIKESTMGGYMDFARSVFGECHREDLREKEDLQNSI